MVVGDAIPTVRDHVKCRFLFLFVRAEEANIAARTVSARPAERSHASRSIGGIMDQATIELLPRRAGLEKALAEFPDDVADNDELRASNPHDQWRPTSRRTGPSALLHGSGRIRRGLSLRKPWPSHAWDQGSDLTGQHGVQRGIVRLIHPADWLCWFRDTGSHSIYGIIVHQALPVLRAVLKRS
jgi:hypothetical protein